MIRFLNLEIGETGMSGRKMTGIVLMVSFAGAFAFWSLQAASDGIAGMAISALFALGIFLAWRFLVWDGPRKTR
jgi:hypothetical protein